MLFVEIYAKNMKCGYLNPILGKLGVTHDFGRWFIFAGVNFLTEILPGWGRPPETILGIRKVDTLGYPILKTASL